jgi:hypothetical protein
MIRKYGFRSIRSTIRSLTLFSAYTATISLFHGRSSVSSIIYQADRTHVSQSFSALFSITLLIRGEKIFIYSVSIANNHYDLSLLGNPSGARIQSILWLVKSLPYFLKLIQFQCFGQQVCGVCQLFSSYLDQSFSLNTARISFNNRLFCA